MNCSHCGKKIEGNGVLINTDGDFVCNDKCKNGYEKERDHFFDDIVQSPEKTEAWLKGVI